MGAAVAVALFGAGPERGPDPEGAVLAAPAGGADVAQRSAGTALAPAGQPAPPVGTAPAPLAVPADGGDGAAGDPTAVAVATPTIVEPESLDFEHATLTDLRAATLARITYPWQSRLPGWVIEFLPGKDGYLGATWSRTHRIEIYVRDGQSIDELAFTLAHELGHAVDLTYFDEADRQRWLALRGAPGASWWTDSGKGDYAVGAGDFAEAFAVWQVGGRSLSTLAEQPTEAQLDALAELVLG